FLERFKFVERARLNVSVYFFHTKEEFHAYAPEQLAQHGGFAGFYHAAPDRAVISVGPIADWQQARPLIFHEYVHHLFRAAEVEPAAWFNEGMAELLASIEVVGDTIEVGHPHATRIQALREGKLLPLATLFATTHDSSIFKTSEHTGVFYAEAWALLHYWNFGESGIPRDAVTRFTRVAGEQKLVAAGAIEPFFQQCFGMDYAEMQKRLERYVESGRYRFCRQPRPVIPAAKTYLARALPREEARVRLAELALRTRRDAMAKFLMLDALAGPAASAGKPDPRILEALGADAHVEGDATKAAERWEEALAAGTKNPAIVRELGLLESKQWFQRFDPYFQLPGETAERLRARLRASIAHEPEQSAAYEMLAWVEGFAEHPSSENVNLVQKRFPLLRQKGRTLLALALVRVRLHAPAEALELLDKLPAVQTDMWTTHAGEMVRGKLAGTPAYRERGPAPEANPLAAADMLRPRVRVPSVELPEKYSGK
ncbi:MAG TPA: hypothetical protein VM029_03845, partial [Opitutaceae bacterium]|nr:hypothetical protein [Opitutaceae bacterium]